MKMVSGVWTCSANTSSLPTCSEGQILKIVSGSWSCANAPVAAGDHFGGEYATVNSSSSSNGACYKPNPLTGSCSCLSGYSPALALIGHLVPGTNEFSNLYLCNK